MSKGYIPPSLQKPEPSALDKIQQYGGLASMISSLGGSALLHHFAVSQITTPGSPMQNFAANLNALDPGMNAQVTEATIQNGLQHPTTFLQQFSVYLGKAMAVAGVVMGSISTFQGIQNMFKNGIQAMAMANLAQSTLGIAMGANALFGHAALMASLTNPIGWAIAAGVIAFSIIWALTHQDPDQKALKAVNDKLAPVYWTAGPVLAVGLGTAAMLFGWTQGLGTPPVMASITIPAYSLSRVLTQTSGFSSVPLDGKTPTVLTEHGAAEGDPDKVMIVSPAGSNSEGDALVTVNTFELFKNMQFVSSSKAPNSCYIPFFIYVNGQPEPNPAAIKGLTTSQKLLEAVIDGRLSTTSSVSGVQVASASNKDCIDPSTL